MEVAPCRRHCRPTKAPDHTVPRTISGNNSLPSPEWDHDDQREKSMAVWLEHWSHLWWERLKETSGPFCKVTLHYCWHSSSHWSQRVFSLLYTVFTYQCYRTGLVSGLLASVLHFLASSQSSRKKKSFHLKILRAALFLVVVMLKEYRSR